MMKRVGIVYLREENIVAWPGQRSEETQLYLQCNEQRKIHGACVKDDIRSSSVSDFICTSLGKVFQAYYLCFITSGSI